jgi:hypothetical protein
MDVGYPMAEIPLYKKYAEEAGTHRLFVNWHPAPLGHEVVGHQVAFYHLMLMERALTKVGLYIRSCINYGAASRITAISVLCDYFCGRVQCDSPYACMLQCR